MNAWTYRQSGSCPACVLHFQFADERVFADAALRRIPRLARSRLARRRLHPPHPAARRHQAHRPATGELLRTIPTLGMPDGVIYKPCGNRRATTCPGCAETYRRDAYHLIRAGLTGGKGITPDVATHPAMFATFTAPSFGPVHTRPVRQHTCTDKTRCTCRPEPCHPRRRSRHAASTGGQRPASPGTGPMTPGSASRCARTATTTPPTPCGTTRPGNCGGAPSKPSNAASASSPATAASPDPRPGRRRPVPARLPVRVAHGKAAEYQARGAVHFHALLRLDGYDPRDPDTPAATRRPVITVADLQDATRLGRPGHQLPHRTAPGPPGGWPITWGTQTDIRVITMTGTGDLTDLAVASYLAKYSTKGTETTGHASARITADTLDLYANPEAPTPNGSSHACWTLGDHPDYTSLRRWAHMLGFGGHFLTKARRYSITLPRPPPGPHHLPAPPGHRPRTRTHPHRRPRRRGNHPDHRHLHLHRNRLENKRRRAARQHRRRPSPQTPPSRTRPTRRRIQPRRIGQPEPRETPANLTIKRQNSSR